MNAIKNITIGLFAASTILLADNTINRDQFLLDSDYVNGMLYLEGQKGLSTIIKEISNCPYDKCRKSDITGEEVTGTVKIEIDKPDYKSAVKLLSKSVDNGNFLAADKLLGFLVKRIDYRSKYPDKFILEMLKEDTNLSFDEYKKIIKKSITLGSSTKGCASPYFYGEFLENGYLDFPVIKEDALEYYLKAYNNCPNDSFYYLMSKGKVNK